MMFPNPFQAFYNTPVAIGKVTGGGSYSNPDGKFSVMGEVKADVQPYSGGLAEKEYGLVEQVELQMFCDRADFIRQGNIAVVGKEKYDILYAEDWEFGAMALLRKRRV